MSDGSMRWSEGLAKRAAGLRVKLEKVDPAAFRGAVEKAGRERFKRFLASVEGYRRHPYRRSLSDPPVAFSKGATRLLDYGRCPEAAGGVDERPAVLFAPSLVNRAYILDLSGERSLMRYLAARGIRPFLVDWGEPGPEERALGLDDYILDRLGGCLDVVSAANGGRPVPVAGYCMGGLLALALAQLRPETVSGLALLATPWDFHADGPGDGHGEGGAQARLTARLMAPAFPFFEALGVVPVDTLQTIFASLDPCLALRKFLAFSGYEPDSEKAQAFVALEDWLNDGVALPVEVARACLLGWYGENLPARGRWLVDGKTIEPAKLDLPSLIVVPENDRIVPPASALALAGAIAGARTLCPPAGHIGMVVGSRGRTHVWEPLAEWIESLPA
ncbi:MAG: alpha/beta fold hydrolase [Alphaproteobacteria bacterium]